MNKILKIIILIFIIFSTKISSYAQNVEINAFKKQNKALLKQLKKEYGITPEVKLSQDGFFYIIFTKKENKKGPNKYFIVDEAGEPLYRDWLDKFSECNGGYLFIGQNVGEKTKWGVTGFKRKQILPIKYDEVSHRNAIDAGTYTDSPFTFWYPGSNECWVATDNSFVLPVHVYFSADGSVITHKYHGNMKSKLSYYNTIDKSSGSSISNKRGLYTLDGEEIFSQEYNNFYIETSGFVNCYKKESDGLNLCGGKMLDSTITNIVVPPMFHDVTYKPDSKIIMCKLHRDDKYEEYDPKKTYIITFKDKGERLYDIGKYQDVISFYEGVGYGTTWGDYYMGLAAEKIAKAELDKMNSVIRTLKSDDNYYLPIKKPEEYKFDAGTISGMYTSAGIYLEKYINNNVSKNDPTLDKARKLRGEIIEARNNFTKKIDEYKVALQSATNRNIERERRIAEEEALRQQQAAEAAKAVERLTRSLINLF